MYSASPTVRLFAGIERFGAAIALVDERGQYVSYVELAAIADHSVVALGETPRLVVVEGSNCLASIAAYIGAVRAGHVVILTKPGSSDDRILKHFCPRFLFGLDCGWQSVAAPSDITLHPDLALLLSTSGSSGAPKLIRLSHANLLANATAIGEYLMVSVRDRALTTLPLFYSYGMSVVNSHLIAGASLILDERSVIEPELWARFEAEHGTSFAGVPYSFELLEQAGFLDSPPCGLRYVTAAGGKLPAATVERFAASLERIGAELFVMYGQTEASPRIAYLPPDQARTHPGSIGRAIPGGELRLVDEYDRELLAPQTVGELIYRGPNVMMGYAAHPEDLGRGQESNELRTGDLARREENGLFSIVGRLSRFVKMFGLRIDLDDVERWCRERVPDAAVAGDDDGIMVAITAPAAMNLQSALASKLGIPLARVSVAEIAELPRLVSGKIDYPGVLSLRAAYNYADTGKQSERLTAELAHLLGHERIHPSQSFIEAGGDSLTIVAASLLVEERLGCAPPGWERLPVSELGQASPASESRPGVPPDALARCLCILLVVLHHGADLPIDGGAIGLLIIAGYNFGRLQTAAVAKRGVFVTAFNALRRVIPLYLVIMALYFSLKREIFIPNLLFYSTFANGYDDGRTVIGLYWFIETYSWLIVISCLLVANPMIAEIDRRRDMLLPLGLLFVAVLVHLLATPIGDHVRAVDMRSPPFLYYIFAIGWASTFASTDRRRLLLSVIAVALLIFMPAHKFTTGLFVTIPVTLMLVWTARIEVASQTAARAVAAVAGSSLYIYLVHPLVFMPLLWLFGTGSLGGTPVRVIGAILLTIPLSAIAGLAAHKAASWAGVASAEVVTNIRRQGRSIGRLRSRSSASDRKA